VSYRLNGEFDIEMFKQNKTKVNLKGILKPIRPYLNEVDMVIAAKLKTGVPIIDKSSAHLFYRGGKKIRASLIILCSGLKGDIPDDVIDVAAAAEIVHAATLIHDDIIDQSIFRRGEITLSKKWGNKIAVLVGDFMYTKALEVAVGQERLDLFPEMVAATCDMVKGELYQIEYSNIDVINKEHYYNIIELKTARFFSACARIGGIKAKMADSEGEILSEFGLNLGFAFQIIDDVLDVIDNTAKAGKDGGNDFLDGKITLPFLHLLELSDLKERDLLYAYASNPDLENWNIVKQKILDSRSIDYCIDRARDYIDKALSHLDYFPDSLCKGIILELSEFLLERTY
jgi:octaprenyl-diphosphate synthase